MMATVDSKDSTLPNPGYSTATLNPGYSTAPPLSTTETRQFGTINRRFLQSPAGILTIVAEVFAFFGLIATEVVKSDRVSYVILRYNHWGNFTFHEFCVVTSWLCLAIFIAAAVFSIDKSLNIKSTIMAYILIVHSAFWAFFLLISSSCMATISSHYVFHSAAGASAAFGFLEMFALLGVVISIFAPPFFGRENTSIF